MATKTDPIADKLHSLRAEIEKHQPGAHKAQRHLPGQEKQFIGRQAPPLPTARRMARKKG